MRNDGVWGKIVIHLLSTNLVKLVSFKNRNAFFIPGLYDIEWKIKKSSWNNTEESKLKCESVPCYVNNDSVQCWTSRANNFYESITKARCLDWILKSMPFGWLSFILFILEYLFIVLWYLLHSHWILSFASWAQMWTYRI